MKRAKNSRGVSIAVGLLLAVHAGLLGYAASVHSPTALEPAQLAAGVSNWEFGRFELYRVNPPLVRLLAAMPLMIVGHQEDWRSFYEQPGARPGFSIGNDFVEANGARSLRLFTLARWACIPLSLIGGYVCFLWSRALFGAAAGLIALMLWCFDPNILAHGELITNDVGGAALGLLAGYTFWRWLKMPTWSWALCAGGSLGLAELAKMSWVPLFALWPALWLLHYMVMKRTAGLAGKSAANAECKSVETETSAEAGVDAADVGTNTRVLPRTREKCAFGLAEEVQDLVSLASRQHNVRFGHQFIQFLTIYIVAIYLLNLAYGFDDTCRRLKEYTFVSRSLTGLAEPGEPGNRFAGHWLGEVPIPVPSQYLIGLDVQRKDFEHYNRRSYLRGEWKQGGWWYYYLYGLAVKLPHGTQLLLLLGLMGLVASARHTLSGFDALVLASPALLLFVLVSAQTEFNIHFRYVLPCFGFAFVGIGSCWTNLKHPACRLLILLSLAACVGSTLSVYPHSLAYFNELSGGPASGDQHLLASSLDWGQDAIYVKEWIDDHPQHRPLFLTFEGHLNPANFGVQFQNFPRAGRTVASDDAPPTLPVGWYIISVNKLAARAAPEMVNGQLQEPRLPWSFFQSQKPVAKIGYTHRVFQIVEGSD